MRLEEDIKLDYSDVLFRPKRSTLQSRKDVNLKRTYKFKYSKNEWSGIPIMAANMDGVGELEIAEKLSEFGMITCLTKQHDVKKLKKNKNIKKIYPHLALSIGIKKEDFENLNSILKEFNFIKLNSLRTSFKFSKSSFFIPALNARCGYIFLIFLFFFNFLIPCCFVRHVIISN